MKKRALITGVSGLLGSNLAFYLRGQYDVLGLYNLHPVIIEGVNTQRVDLLSGSSFSKCVESFCPDVIVHCASITNVDFCETNKELTRRVNIGGTKTIAKSIGKSKTKLVYISTDSVYDGVKGGFLESDPINPLNYYGKTKYEGEQAASEHGDSLIFRTNIFGWNVQNKESLAEWILNELTKKNVITCFEDARFSSIYTFELAKILSAAFLKDLRGVYNCGSSTSLSKYEFAIKLAGVFGLDKSLIKPIAINNSSLKAKRGKNLSLNVEKLSRELNYEVPSIDECVKKFYQDFRVNLPAKVKHSGKVFVMKNEHIIPYGRQSIDESDIQAVVEVLRSSNVTQGPKVVEFELALCEETGANYAVAVNSGTSALHIACLAADVGPGDEVITSPNTFVASANCVVYCGATPVFADIDPDTYNISLSEIEKKITSRTKAIIPVHFAGQSCDMEGIYQLVKEKEKQYNHKIFVIEDACHALGSIYKGQKVGSCVFSDMVVTSFHPVKHITTGEGGVVLTKDEMSYIKMKRLRSHGITSDKMEFVNINDNTGSDAIAPWYYEQVDLGFNYRITDIQCALGFSQLKKMEQFSKRRREIILHYNKSFGNLNNVKIPYESTECDSNFHLYVLLFDFNRVSFGRGEFMNKLRNNGIQSQVHYIPVHTQPYYQNKYGFKWGDYPNAEDYYRKCLTIPLYPAMTDADVNTVISIIEESFH